MMKLSMLLRMNPRMNNIVNYINKTMLCLSNINNLKLCLNNINNPMLCQINQVKKICSIEVSSR